MDEEQRPLKPQAPAPYAEDLSTSVLESLSEDTITGAACADDLEAQAEDAHKKWFQQTYQGDHVPQLTWRAVIVGGLLGSLMSISNLYTMLKLGWAFGVAITACVLSFVIWSSLRKVFPRLSPMSILENNCMQSTASAAGYSTGATIATAFGAYLLLTGRQIDWRILAPWTLLTALLGVFLAVPLKRQMINTERLAFPSGIAAAETLRSLYARSQESIRQAHALVCALATGVVVGLARQGEPLFQLIGFKPGAIPQLKELIEIPYTIAGKSLPSFGFEPSVLLLGAGMIVGLRVSASMLLGSCLLYLFVGPALIESHATMEPGQFLVAGKLLKWSLWTGTALMVSSGLTAFALQWRSVVRSFASVKIRATTADGNSGDIDKIEVPIKWMILGLLPTTIALLALQFAAFSITPLLGLLSIALSFILGLVACRATGETDITPIGAMGKLTQLIYAALSPGNAITNLMTASVTANSAIGAADLLIDLKSGYLLGANPRRQFLAQFIGVFFGTVAIVPAWYLMVPNKEVLESFNPPSTHMWLAVAQALSQGIQSVPETARWGIAVGGLLGIALALGEHLFPRARRWMPSAMGLGLSWVMSFSNCLAFFLGAAIASVWMKLHVKTAEPYTVPIASGAIAGESIACAIIAIIRAAAAIAPH